VVDTCGVLGSASYNIELELNHAAFNFVFLLCVLELHGMLNACSLLLLLLLQSLFTRLTVLLELAAAEAADAAETQPPLPCCCRAILCSHTQAAHTAAAAAASPRPHMQQLEQIVDEAQTLMYLANCHNHLPMFQSVVIHLETGQHHDKPTQQHRMRVARRMELTPWQVGKELTPGQRHVDRYVLCSLLCQSDAAENDTWGWLDRGEQSQSFLTACSTCATSTRY
jgi:hypothetical protein